MHDDGSFWKVLGTCFSLGAAASLFNTLREPVLPPLRQLIATWFYAGFSAVAIGLALIHFCDAKSNALLYFASLAGGLGSVDVLTAVWAKAIPTLTNYASEKFAGKKVFDDKGQGGNKPEQQP